MYYPAVSGESRRNLTICSHDRRYLVTVPAAAGDENALNEIMNRIKQDFESAIRKGQNSNRIPSCTSRFGNAAVNPSGWLGETVDVPRTVNGGANAAPARLFTLE